MTVATTIKLRVDDEIIAWLKAEADRLHTTVSEVARRAIVDSMTVEDELKVAAERLDQLCALGVSLIPDK
jgi:predicted transcriptional regulator